MSLAAHPLPVIFKPLKQAADMTTYIKKFNEIGRGDLAEAGGKNASLGEMYNQLASRGIMVPNGFATTSRAFRVFL